MAHIKRYLEEKIVGILKNRKIILVYGARQVGKTTLVQRFIQDSSYTYLNGDFLDDQDRLKETTRSMVSQFASCKTLIIDEAQNIPDIGKKLKVIHDTYPNMCIIATGSSSFDLSNKVGESLTGRSVTLKMFPLSMGEVSREKLLLEDILLYGMYPDVFLQKNAKEKQETLMRIAESYLFKDVLNIEYIKNPKSLERLLRVLASQVGSEISFTEIANTLDMDVKTIMGYTDILEKLFIIFPLLPLASNVRKSLTKKRKYYFFDLGIRNAVLGDFSSLKNRNDRGALWENFVIVERMKANFAKEDVPQYFFFRSYKGEEIDLIEKRNDGIRGFECKFSKEVVSARIQKIYMEDLFGEGDLLVIHKENYTQFLV